MNNKSTKRMKIIHSLDEIPERFESEDAERDWWAEHDYSKELYESLPDLTSELDEVSPLPKSRQRPKRRAS